MHHSRSSAAKEAILLSCTGVTKDFEVHNNGHSWRVFFGSQSKGKQVRAVDNASLSVPKGEFVGILGRNGAGKSTLLRILGGSYSHNSGSIRCSGDMTGLYELGGMGNPYLSGVEYAKRFLLLYGVTARDLPNLLYDIKSFSELEEAFDRPIHTYSSGMAARLYFATATALQHEVYLIDEVLAVGDEHFQNKCWSRMRERLGRGASGILVTHDWSAVLKVCRQCHIMDKGKVVESGGSEEIVRSYLALADEELSEGAKFTSDLPKSFKLRSSAESTLEFDVLIQKRTPVTFRYSIEFMRVGYGWETALLGHEPLGPEPGKYRVQIAFDRLPLPPGDYYLNLFLAAPIENESRARAIYDAKSWTHGEAIRLQVTGAPRPGSVVMPLVPVDPLCDAPTS